MRQASKLVALTVAITFLGAVVALGVSLLLPREYASRTELVYQISAEQPTGFLREDRNLTTQVELIKSRQVLSAVAASSGLTVPQLEQKVDVTLLEGSLIIDIEVRDPDPQIGRELAKAITDRYLEVSRPVDQPAVRAYLNRELGNIRSQLASASPDAIGPLRERQAKLQDQLDNLDLRVLGPLPAQVIIPPYSLEEPVSPRPLLGAATGALTGLMIALGLVVFVARRWTRS
jgi:capsular polysaccharide biosynthesis protein